MREVVRSKFILSSACVMTVIGSALAAAAGCGSDATLATFGDGTIDAGDDGSSITGSVPLQGFGDGTEAGASAGQFESIVIAPLDPVVTVDLDQKTPAIEFTAKGIDKNGQESVLTSGAWSFARIDVASFEGKTLVPTGFIGGTGEVSFSYNGQTAKTKATVKLRIRAGAEPAPAIVAALAGATEADSAVTLQYPYDGTVFPRGLPAPVLQWQGGGGSDLYKIQITSDSFDFVEYAAAAPPSRYTLPTTPADVWAKLTDSTAGAVSLSVQRWDGTKAYRAKTQSWKVAPANLKGTIYYTQLLNGDTFVQRIKPGGTSEGFLQKTSGVSCIACHSVSRDGSRIVASVNGGASPWAVYDTVTGNELYRSSQPSGFQAISPNGSHVLWRHWNGGGFGSEGELRLSTTASDAVLATLAPGVAGASPGHPVWSPDGKTIAFSMRTAGNGLNFSASTLWTTHVDLGASPPSFSETKKIVDSNATFGVVTYPTFSPDSNWIAFMRATNSNTAGSNRGELWLASKDGTTQVRLDRANGVPDLSATPETSWGPSFHPVAAGGYFWMAFFSERPYGNTFNGANRQIWLAAVDGAPTAGVDPSHPAIYITGQNQAGTNERPQFTVNPCQPIGQTCENGYDCCDGYCRKGDGGGMVCQTKGTECAQQGDKCAGAGDCCSGLLCIGGFCANPPPK